MAVEEVSQPQREEVPRVVGKFEGGCRKQAPILLNYNSWCFCCCCISGLYSSVSYETCKDVLFCWLSGCPCHCVDI